MKVWVVVGAWDREGYAEPIGVFSSKELATRAVQDGCKEYDFTEVMEYELDAVAETKAAPPDKDEAKGETP